MGIFFPTDPESVLPVFATDDVTDSTSGKLNVIEPPSDQKQYGWYPYRKRPERSIFNWLHRHTYKQLKYWKDVFFPAVDAGMANHENRIDAIELQLTERIKAVDTISYGSVSGSVLTISGLFIYKNKLGKIIQEPYKQIVSSYLVVGTDYTYGIGVVNNYSDGGSFSDTITNLSASGIKGYPVWVYKVGATYGIWIGEDPNDAVSQISTKMVVPATDVYLCYSNMIVLGTRNNVTQKDIVVSMEYSEGKIFDLDVFYTPNQNDRFSYIPIARDNLSVPLPYLAGQPSSFYMSDIAPSNVNRSLFNLNATISGELAFNPNNSTLLGFYIGDQDDVFIQLDGSKRNVGLISFKRTFVIPQIYSSIRISGGSIGDAGATSLTTVGTATEITISDFEIEKLGTWAF